jgi:predicted anti-sigma-YlaC factor YlaD
MEHLIMTHRFAVLSVALALSACNLKTVAMRSLADAVAEPGNTYARDDDPQLVASALPVLLKIMEQLRDGLPDHKGIRLALVRNFTSFGVAFVKDEADRLSETNVQRGKEVYGRARRLLMRAYGYGLEGLELAAPGFRGEFTSGNPERRKAAVSRLTKKEDVPLLFWTAAALGSAISSAKDDMNLVGELPLVETLMTRAIQIDESYDEGALHEFFITYDMTRGAGRGGGPASAEKHYRRALELGQNKKLSPHVTWAEDVLVEQQNKKEFVRVLEMVVATDVDKDLDHRLVNVIAQRRARWLLSRTADLFAE